MKQLECTVGSVRPPAKAHAAQPHDHPALANALTAVSVANALRCDVPQKDASKIMRTFIMSLGPCTGLNRVDGEDVPCLCKIGTAVCEANRPIDFGARCESCRHILELHQDISASLL